MFSSSVYGYSEQNHLASYTGHRGRQATAKMGNEVKHPTDNSQAEEEEI